MNTCTPKAIPTDTALSENVTADACTTAAWVLTDAAHDLLEQMEEFVERFSELATHAQVKNPISHAIGLRWALEMFVACQCGDLWRSNDNGKDLRPAEEGE